MKRGKFVFRMRTAMWLSAIVMVVRANAVSAQGTPPTIPAQISWATVTYLSGATVYLEVGSKQGIREGLSLEVVRGGVTIGQLLAQFVSSNRTAGTLASGSITLLVGDSVRFHPDLKALEAANPQPVAATATARRRTSPLRGRVGARYLVVTQGNGTTLRQPAIDLRIDGNRLGGTGVGMNLDVRANRTSVSSSQGSSSPPSLTRVYQAAMTYERGTSGTQWVAGRQFATTLSPIGIFDGASLNLNGSRWGSGVLAGTQPEPATFSPSAAVTELGAWIQRHQAPGARAPWSALFGVIGSYDRGQINREFAYLQANYTSAHFSFYAAQEIDFNRGWKRDAEGATLTPTSTFGTARYSPSDALTLSIGTDSRRSVRLYRDFVNPEINFDDAHRQGQWGEVAVRLSSHLLVSTDARRSGSTGTPSTSTYTATFSANRLTALQLGARARITQYAGPGSEGSVGSFTLEANPTSAVRISLSAGQRTSGTPGITTDKTRLSWTGFDTDLAIGRSLYLMFSTYREAGSLNASTQTYGGISWRF